MENIWRAIERAKEQRPNQDSLGIGASAPQNGNCDQHANVGRAPGYLGRAQQVELDRSRLEARRIIGHDAEDPRCRSFDMLRVQVLRSMDQKGWKVVAVTSPTAGCGKTLTAINLALSAARRSERQILLMDMDLRKPQVANCLGLKPSDGVLGVLEGNIALSSAIVQASIAACRFEVLPTASTRLSSDLMGSLGLTTLLDDARRRTPSRTIILDLPPLLGSHDVMEILPQVDCVLLVAAVGTTTVSEMEEARKQLQSVDVVRVVVNKSAQSTTDYYY